MPVNLEPILPHMAPFLMVLFRISGLFIFAPFFGATAVPMRIKTLLSLVLAFCIYPTLGPVQAIDLAIPTLVYGIAAELMIGISIGFLASLPVMAMQFGGQMIGYQIVPGRGVFNPDTGSEDTVIEKFFYWLAIVVFLTLNGHHVLLGILIKSFGPNAVPLMGYVPDGSLLRGATMMLQVGFELGLRVAAPILCLVFLQMTALGFVAKTVPQFNILSLGFPLRVILGLALTSSLILIIAEPLADMFMQTFFVLSQLFGATA